MSMRQKEPPEILLTPVQMVCAVWEVSSRRLFEPEGRAGVRFLLSFPAACNSLISDITSPLLGHQLNHALISIPPVRGFLLFLSFLSRQRSIAGSCHLNTQPLQLAPIWLPFAFDACNLLDMDKRWHVWGILTEDEGKHTTKACSEDEWSVPPLCPNQTSLVLSGSRRHTW